MLIILYKVSSLQVHFNLKKVGREAFISKKKKKIMLVGISSVLDIRLRFLSAIDKVWHQDKFVIEIFDFVLRISFS